MAPYSDADAEARAAWELQRAEARRASGLEAAEAAATSAADAAIEAFEALLAVPAPDVAAIIIKIELAGVNNYAASQLGAVIADLRRVGARA